MASWYLFRDHSFVRGVKRSLLCYKSSSNEEQTKHQITKTSSFETLHLPSLLDILAEVLPQISLKEEMIQRQLVSSNAQCTHSKSLFYGAILQGAKLLNLVKTVLFCLLLWH